MSREAQESSAITKANKNNQKIKQFALLRDQSEKEKLVQEEELNKQAIIFQEVSFKIDILEKTHKCLGYPYFTKTEISDFFPAEKIQLNYGQKTKIIRKRKFNFFKF